MTACTKQSPAREQKLRTALSTGSQARARLWVGHLEEGNQVAKEPRTSPYLLTLKLKPGNPK